MTQVRLHRPEPESSPPPKTRESFFTVRRTQVMLLLAIVLGFIALGFASDYIPSRSMEPTLRPGDHTVTMRAWLAYPFGTSPARGDVITFHYPGDPEEDSNASDSGADTGDTTASDTGNGGRSSRESIRGGILIKRVIGLPGDVVWIHSGKVSVNGQDLVEPYITRPWGQGEEYGYGVSRPLKVPRGQFYVLGDNRDDSDDSRFWGTVKRNLITGKFLFVLFHREVEGTQGQSAQGENAP
ncbi:MAG TPA: signal peptidase I [Chthonomonadaceae bacterium]|nr:signal peptidase I [Chthonomonadaceae bacterium]